MGNNIINKITHKLKFGAAIIKTYKTWPLAFLDYFKIIRNKKIVHRLRNGVKCKIRTGTYDFGIINEVYILKEYHKNMDVIKNNAVVIDIGAHIGTFSIFVASQAKNVQVYSFEPFKGNFKLLEDNIKLNKLQKRIHAFNLGVGKRKGKRKLFIDESCTGGHSFFNVNKNRPSVTIKIISLEDIFKENKLDHVDFLKMDCEGAESEILLNAPPEILKKIKSITLEYHSSYVNVEEIVKYLKELGFNITFRDKSGILYAKRR